MIIIGHPWIESPTFFKVFHRDDIQKTQANQIVLLEPLNESHSIAQYCRKNAVSFAVTVNTLEDALYANALGASYIICEEDDAALIQPVANEYLFDMRILVHIHSEKEMLKIARSGIDGVIYQLAIC